ncbi:MAG TPA: phosphotriesterase-related protein [Armatimonadetes bacterium]|nr:phosphotriesterase-related protein [Armatimonadota bacterium]
MLTVETVSGPVAAEELGVTDYHEHLCFQAPAWLLREDPDFALNDVDKSAEELRAWHAAGGKTLLEMSAIDFGRDIRAVRQIAKQVPEVNIIATTGFNKPYYCDRWVAEAPEAELVKLCVRDLTVGIDGTDSKAGVIKGGTGYNMITPLGAKLLRVAAQAHLETGAPIITHTEAGTMGLEQLELLAAAGVSPKRVCLSHLDRNPDFWLHRKIAEAGAYLGYDCPGKIKYGPDELRISVLRRLVEAGYGKQILLGNDLGRPSYWRSYGGGPGLDFVLTKFVPRLREEGFSEETLQDLLVNNPRRFLAGREEI